MNNLDNVKIGTLDDNPWNEIRGCEHIIINLQKHKSKQEPLHIYIYCKTLHFYFFIFHVRENEKRCHCCDSSFWQIEETKDISNILMFLPNIMFSPFLFCVYSHSNSSFMQKSLIIFFPIILISLVWSLSFLLFQTSALHNPLYEKFVGWFTIYD